MDLIQSYRDIKTRRKKTNLSEKDYVRIQFILDRTTMENIDNISRTKAYEQFYRHNVDIKWSFLASMVSRNAGWNMTDLEGKWFPQILSKGVRKDFFNTYERANWLIFSDAYPQLLLYEMSLNERTPLFNLLQCFDVSPFMEFQWERFWVDKDEQKLMKALIINEQNVIQDLVILHHYYKKKVFGSFPYQMQDWLHFSSVLFPTLNGKLFGFSVHDFTKVNSRITLGKRLAWLLFHPALKEKFERFSAVTEHTGSRYDYERYLKIPKKREAPFLRTTYPVIDHHRHVLKDWFQYKVKKTEKCFADVNIPYHIEITDWYLKKQEQLHAAIVFEKYVWPRTLGIRN